MFISMGEKGTLAIINGRKSVVIIKIWKNVFLRRPNLHASHTNLYFLFFI